MNMRFKLRKFILRLLLAGASIALVGCDTGLRHMGTTEVGVRFRKLPVFLGGGIAEKVAGHGETIVVMPWENIYRLDTKVKQVSWGAAGFGRDPSQEDYVHTRALDGNEVALAVQIQYRITTDPAALVRLVQDVATSNEGVEELVTSVARSDIRLAMNRLRTAAFFDNEAKYGGEAEVKKLMQAKLGAYGIDIISVNLREHRFERALPDGSIDRSYQEKINEVQTTEEQTKRERLRVTTVKADKEREFNAAQSAVNRVVEEAKGYLEQTKLSADAYFEAKKNEAEAIRKAGKAQAEALVQQINAFSGPGGEALLKLELAKALLRSDPRFVLMSESGKENGVDVTRVDTNELMSQIGIFEGLKNEPPRVANSAEMSVQQQKDFSQGEAKR